MEISTSSKAIERCEDLCSCGRNKKNPEKMKSIAFCVTREDQWTQRTEFQKETSSLWGSESCDSFHTWRRFWSVYRQTEEHQPQMERLCRDKGKPFQLWTRVWDDRSSWGLGCILNETRHHSAHQDGQATFSVKEEIIWSSNSSSQPALPKLF